MTRPRSTIESAFIMREPSTIAVLTSGGLDSVILCSVLSREHERVQPICVAFGLRWEEQEREALYRFLAAAGLPRVEPPVVLQQPVADLYGDHWSVGSGSVPQAGGDDDEVYLPGRNLLLLAKSAVWCGLHGVRKIALGCLSGNPFDDAAPRFFEAFSAAVGPTLPRGLEILAPFGRLKKREVMRMGRDLPLELTLSCLNPTDGIHCGRCNKCAERRDAFADSGLTDSTPYLS